MKINAHGFTGAEVIMVLITILVVGGGLWFVLTQDPITAEDEAAAELSATETNQTGQDASESEDVSESLNEAAARDEERAKHLKTVASDLEAFFALNGNYPTTAQYNDTGFRQSSIYTTEASNEAHTTYEIMYNVRPSSCDNETFICASYDVAVDVERDGLGENDADGNTADILELSIN